MRLRTRAGALEVGTLASDYDRTLTRNGAPDPDAVAALREAREAGVRVVVATGRPRWQVDPGVRAAADAVVLEGGPVVWGPGGVQVLAPPEWVGMMRRWLEGRGVPFEAKEASFSVATGDLGALAGCPVPGIALQNHDRVDVTPPGLDKGEGLRSALEALGRPAGAVVAVGDGANDVPLLLAAQHGVAVANAVPELKAVAHEVLLLPAGEGVAAFVRDRLLGGAAP